MSALNPEVSEKFCGQCWHRRKPYLSKFGTYTPCLKCKDGSNMQPKAEEKHEEVEP